MPPGFGVVVQVPLDAQIVDGLEAQPRGHRRKVARRGQKGHRAQIQRGIEDIAPAGDQRPPKLGSIKSFCAICQLAHSRACGRAARRAAVRRRRRACCIGGPQIEALRQREAGLVGVGGDVGGIEQQHVARLRADAAHVAVVELRLDHVAQFAMPAGQREIPLERRRPEIHGGFEIDAVERIVADGGNAAVRARQVGVSG